LPGLSIKCRLVKDFWRSFTIEAVPSGELSSMIRISNGIVREEMALIIASMFSFSLNVGIMTIFDIIFNIIAKIRKLD
jgi:hypothetical protein